jgi:hypothetical protein
MTAVDEKLTFSYKCTVTPQTEAIRIKNTYKFVSLSSYSIDRKVVI